MVLHKIIELLLSLNLSLCLLKDETSLESGHDNDAVIVADNDIAGVHHDTGTLNWDIDVP